jgi:hypothetical protein
MMPENENQWPGHPCASDIQHPTRTGKSEPGKYNRTIVPSVGPVLIGRQSSIRHVTALNVGIFSISPANSFLAASRS